MLVPQSKPPIKTTTTTKIGNNIPIHSIILQRPHHSNTKTNYPSKGTNCFFVKVVDEMMSKDHMSFLASLGSSFLEMLLLFTN
jgi:hypothetical protein